ncbi:hypothetical protein TIFTF001_015458 [Ficus carica]|uniref:Uncharacterized protein n=1 Tax=Ficus carica TaxID=3494 RepID=A0AA88D8Z3_FICCA|nr:hypothetical protein TIFTF001_015458 [Ficus carica]
MDNSETQPVLDEEPTPTNDGWQRVHRRAGDKASPSRSRGSSGKRKQRETTEKMTYSAMHEIISHFRSCSQSAICALKDEFIRPPDYNEVQPLIDEHSYKYRPWFDNVLATCSFNMKFTYMLASYEGSCNDARMLEEAITFHGFPIPPPGINNYPMEKQVMIPVTCAIVHNFVRMVQVGDPIFGEYAADGVLVVGHVDVNADVMLADGIDDAGPST